LRPSTSSCKILRLNTLKLTKIHRPPPKGGGLVQLINIHMKLSHFSVFGGNYGRNVAAVLQAGRLC
jgi:hypothetical protein